MKTNDNSFFTEPVDARQEARLLALEVVCRLLIWMAEGASLEETRRARDGGTLLPPARFDREATMEEIGHGGGGRGRRCINLRTSSPTSSSARSSLNWARLPRSRAKPIAATCGRSMKNFACGSNLRLRKRRM